MGRKQGDNAIEHRNIDIQRADVLISEEGNIGNLAWVRGCGHCEIKGQ